MMINCEKASELSSKKIDRKLSFMERLSLKFHTMMCSTCSLFEEEIDVLNKAMKHIHYKDCEHKMTDKAKNNLKEILKNQK